jgi:predicted O-methyltransferase YrrM
MIDFFKDNKFLKGFSNHPSNDCNFTCTYFPLLMYLFAIIHGSKNILEIGSAEGYSAYYLAEVAKVNNGMYYGIDINPGLIERVDKLLGDLPHKMICADTKKMDKIDFTDSLDIVWIDGEHTTEAVMHEIELVYPLLKDRGFGFIFLHDIVDMGVSGAWLKLKNDPRFESIGLEANYGLGILRKLDGVRYEEKAQMFEVKHL